jgi:hypothetical protein
VGDFFKDWSTHPDRVIFFGSMWLLRDIVTSLTFFNVMLKGLKQDTFNGCNVCDVCDGNVIMSNPNSFAYFITYRVTWLPCPSIIYKCWLLKDTSPGTNLLKKDKLFTQECSHPSFFLHCHTSTWFAKFNVVIF